MTTAQKGVVYLVGAGPGDPELLTLRALRLLESADVVLHDDLVPDEVLALVHRHALVTSVGKRCGRPRITQAGIHALMVGFRAGWAVSCTVEVGRSAGVWARGGGDRCACAAAEIPFEVVPGRDGGVCGGGGAAAATDGPREREQADLLHGTSCDGQGRGTDLEWAAAGGRDAGDLHARARYSAAGAGAGRSRRRGRCGVLCNQPRCNASTEPCGGARGTDGRDGLWACAGAGDGGACDGATAKAGCGGRVSSRSAA